MNYEATASISHIDFTRSQCLNHTLSAAISSKIIISKNRAGDFA